jgi:hypothetical protein
VKECGVATKSPVDPPVTVTTAGGRPSPDAAEVRKPATATSVARARLFLRIVFI